MVSFRRRVYPALLAVFSLAATAALPGCDWLKSSDALQRSSPFISNLSVSPPTVLCGTANEFKITFRYSDPQGDIAQVNVVLKQDVSGSSAATREEYLFWPGTISPSSGTAEFALSFACDSPGGRWVVTVEVQDNRGHKSNILTSFVTLNSTK